MGVFKPLPQQVVENPEVIQGAGERTQETQVQIKKA